MLYFGTSGFSYMDWVGPVYPKGLPRQAWLEFYSGQFNSLELNTTYYAIPSLAMVKSLVMRTGPEFQFAVKAHQDITHGRNPDEVTYRSFRGILEPFLAAGKLGCLLVQFPYSFGFNSENQAYLERTKARFKDIPMIAELRNAHWIKPEVFTWLKSIDVGFCCVDEPHLPNLMPPVAEATSGIAYVRFHGRNSAKWWQPEQPHERYDYTYKTEELEEWIPKIKGLNDQAEKTFVFANNHWQGQSVDTIRQVRMMLD
jgi:uncharacterized protein YecE (DUF72 family)